MSVGIFSEEFIQVFYTLNERGLPFAKMLVCYGAGFSLGRNFIKMLFGNIRFGVAVSDFIRDVIITFVGGYFIGGIGAGAAIFQAMSDGVVDNSASVLFSSLSALGVNLVVFPEFVVAMSALLIGAFVGVIFGFLFG